MRILVLAVAAFTIALLPDGASAQDEDFPEFRPTPKIELSEDERSALEAQTDGKKYLKLALDLMVTRIKSAETKTSNGEFDEMLADLGGFHALIDAALDYLIRTDARRGKVLDTYKRYEIALRGFAPRIENIRREAPDRYSSYMLKLLKRVRENRARAIEPFFGDSVIPSRKN